LNVTEKNKKQALVERSAARLGAVQALYQMDIAGTDVGETLAQFSSRVMGEDFEGGQCGEADYRHLKDVVDGVVREQKAIDPAVDQILDKAWPLHRLDSTVRAILRAGAYELMFMPRVPARVAISEYVDVADAFFGEEEPRFVNGVLNNLARASRPEEFKA
jgi:N utilization substance protein B